MFSSFKQQGQQWQQLFVRRQQGGVIQRLLAWLMLGLMLFIGVAVLVFMLLLSWILIPILLWRHRARVKAWQQQRQQHTQGQYQQSDSGQQTIEGEVLHKRED